MSIAARYHALTKYDAVNVRQGPGLDWSKQPPPFKEIVSQQRVGLRRHPPVQVEAGRPVPSPATPVEHIDLATLSRLLFFANGVTGLIRYGQGGGQFLRAAPSAGALYPTEVYVAVRDVPGLAPGLYSYLAATHELIRLWEEPGFDTLGRACGDDEAFAGLEAAFVLTGVHWRSAWRYKERGYRRVLLDTGHVVANLAACAATLGLRADVHLGFRDADVNGLFFFDDAEEAALACVGIAGADTPAPACPRWASGAHCADAVEAAPLADADDLAASATVALQRASSCSGPPKAPAPVPRAPVTDRSIPLAAPEPMIASMPTAILHRRSARAYDDGPIPFASLGRAIGFALGRDGDLAIDGTLRCHVIAHTVDGLAPGVYAVEGNGEALLPLAPGDERERCYTIALGQEIARRGAAILVMSACAPEAIARWGDRAYRYLHLDAGVVGERFQLAAQALDLAACGIGGFFDDDAAALVGLTPDDWVCYLVTVGAPTE